MPNICAHMIVAKEVGDRLNIHTDDYFRGNLLPDILAMNMDVSHHRIQSTIYLVPDIKWFLEHLDFTNDLDFGYFIHLLLDIHYLEDYMTKLHPTKDVFSDPRVYNDYDYLNHSLVERFNLDTKHLTNVLSHFDNDINEEKLKYNIKCLNQDTKGTPIYIDFDSFSKFLSEVPNVICEELVEYANKYSDLSIRLGKRKK